LGLAAGADGASVPTTAALSAHRPVMGPIQHVVFIIQASRSFNNLFMGFKGARTQSFGYDDKGRKIALRAAPLAQKWAIDSSSVAYLTDYDDGKLDGWNEEYACCGQPENFAYAYVQRSDSRTYWEMAKQYVLADEFYPSNFDGAFVSHQYAIAAYANHEVNGPSGVASCKGGPTDVIGTLFRGEVPVCQNYRTLGDELDRALLPWRYYADIPGGLNDAYAVIGHVYFGPDYPRDVVHPPSQFVSDVSSGNLAAVSWVTPRFVDS
jgi:phospholipase C